MTSSRIRTCHQYDDKHNKQNEQNKQPEQQQAALPAVETGRLLHHRRLAVTLKVTAAERSQTVASVLTVATCGAGWQQR